MNMFCYQCEQTAKGKGCTLQGVCGKSPEVAALEDLLIYALKGISVYAHKARELGAKDKAIDLFVIEGLFTTITNVDFDPERLQEILLKGYEIQKKARALYLDAYKKQHGRDFEGALPAATGWKPAADLKGLIDQGMGVGIFSDASLNEDIRSLRELLIYGMKGMAAYADHANVLGREDEEVTAWFHKGLEAVTNDYLTVEQLVGLNMEFGKVNLKCMELLDKAHTDHFGNPLPTPVFIGVKKGPAIVVSGHDLFDLEQLLQQTEDKGTVSTPIAKCSAHGYGAEEV